LSDSSAFDVGTLHLFKPTSAPLLKNAKFPKDTHTHNWRVQFSRQSCGNFTGEATNSLNICKNSKGGGAKNKYKSILNRGV
jgi:hypothetical protein